VRVARLDTSTGRLVETPSQVYDTVRQGDQWRARLVFFADAPANGCPHYLVLYGNPCAQRPDYPTDLRVHGQGVGLDVENQHYLARLSRQMGQLERVTYRREHGQELFAGGPGHGEPPGVDWAHDYVTADGFQKMRITNWAQCPNYEVTRGPLCVKVRRWGFPHSPVHPLFTPSRMHIDVTYTFYAGAPYFLKHGAMTIVKDLDIRAMRDDEWVFSGCGFTDPLWLDSRGRVHEGPITSGQEDDMQGIGYFNRQTRDAFVALWLDLEAEGFDDLHRGASPNLYYRPHGHCWARYPAGGEQHFKAGTVLRQRNAYLLAPYFEPGGESAIGQSLGDVRRGPVYSDEGGVSMVENTRRRLLNPLEVESGQLPSGPASAGKPLARRGEAQTDAPGKRAIWDALRDVPDAQFYKADANVVDMGYVYDVRVQGDVVRILVTMPHRGRPCYAFIGDPIRERLLQMDGVREVIVDFTWEPPWTPSRLTDAGRRAMGMPDLTGP
jgi:metal-sulfur cluster biosynthetic enzyme